MKEQIELIVLDGRFAHARHLTRRRWRRWRRRGAGAGARAGADRESMQIPLLNDLVVDLFGERVLEGLEAHVDQLAGGDFAQVDADHARVDEANAEARAGRVQQGAEFVLSWQEGLKRRRCCCCCCCWRWRQKQRGSAELVGAFGAQVAAGRTQDTLFRWVKIKNCIYPQNGFSIRMRSRKFLRGITYLIFKSYVISKRDN